MRPMMELVLMTNNTLSENPTGGGEKAPPSNRGFRPVLSISTSTLSQDPCPPPSRPSSRVCLRNGTVTRTLRCRHITLPVGPVVWWDPVMLQGARRSPEVAFTESCSSSDPRPYRGGEVILVIASESHWISFPFFLLSLSTLFVVLPVIFPWLPKTLWRKPRVSIRFHSEPL